MNEPKNNDKAMKCLVEPIGILVLNDVLKEKREVHLRASVQSALKVRKISIDDLIAVFRVLTQKLCSSINQVTPDK